MIIRPTTPEVREAYADATVDDGFMHHEDYLADLERKRLDFDAWLREYDAQLIERLADRYPVMLRDMVSRGSVRDWLLSQADAARMPQ